MVSPGIHRTPSRQFAPSSTSSDAVDMMMLASSHPAIEDGARRISSIDLVVRQRGRWHLNGCHIAEFPPRAPGGREVGGGKRFVKMGLLMLSRPQTRLMIGVDVIYLFVCR